MLLKYWSISTNTGCGSHFRNPAPFNILKKPLLVLKQTIHQQKALYFSFNLAPWKWAWHYHEAATPSCPQITFFTPRSPMLFAAGGRGALLVVPRPVSGCQIQSWYPGLFTDVLFVSVIAMVLSGYWKALDSGNDFRTLYQLSKFNNFLTFPSCF